MTQVKIPMARVETSDKAGAEQVANAAAAQPAKAQATDASAVQTASTVSEAPAATPQKAAPQPQAKPKAKVRVDDAAPVGEDRAFGSSAVVGTAEEVAHEAKDKPRGSFGWLSKAFPGREYAVLGGLAGLVIALLMFFLGFWKVLFVALVVLVGIAIGQYLDGDPKLVNFLRRIFTESLGDKE